MYEAALEYARLGWRVLPDHGVNRKTLRCTCGDAECESPGKHPRIRDWLNAASFDSSVLDRWFNRFYKMANLAFIPETAAVLDVDDLYGGSDALEYLVARFGPFYDDWHGVKSGGGFHYYYKVKEPVLGASNLFGSGRMVSGLELKGMRHKVTLPPSFHVAGIEYDWLGERPSCVEELPVLPSWLLGGARESAGRLRHLDWKVVLREGAAFYKGERDEMAIAVMGSLRQLNDDESGRWMLDRLCEVNQQAVPPMSHRQVVAKWRQGMKWDPSRERESREVSTECVMGCPR